jgi:hypothetical protein
MVMVEVGKASVPGLPGKGKSALPSPIRVVGSPLMGPPIMVHCRSSGSPRGGGSVMMALEPSPRAERLKPLNQLAMNSTLSKRMVSPREKTSLGEHSTPMAVMNSDDGTIKTV